MVKIIGKTPINPILFITAKIAGPLLWIIVTAQVFGFIEIAPTSPLFLRNGAYGLLIVGVTIMIASFFHLGDALRVGIPKEKTSLKTEGLYRFSRNPIYVGFDVIAIASIILVPNIFVVFIGLYTIIIHHFIILSEERFLRERFKKPYIAYCKRVRRYF